jgi:polysaccharide biosynthesis transport protein
VNEERYYMIGRSADINYSEAALQQEFLQEFVSIFRRKFLSILCYSLALTVILAILVQFLPKTYRAVASVEVLSKTPLVANPDVFSSNEAFTDETAGTELGILQSQELRTAVVRQLDLMADPEFNPDLEPSLLTRVASYIKSSSIANYVPDGWLPSGQAVTEAKALFDTVESFSRRVTAEPVSHSKIIQVSVVSRNPQTAAEIANKTVAEYVAFHARQKSAAYAEAYNFAQQRLPALKAAMLEKLAVVDKFRQEHRMVSGQYAAIRREKLTEASKQVVDAQNRLEQLRAQAAQARSADPMSQPAVLASLTVQRLREQESQIAAEAASRPAGWAPNYALRIAAVEGQIRAEAARIVASLPHQVAAQEATVKSQIDEYNVLQIEVSEMDRRQSELDPLENDAKIATKQYNDFMSSDSTTKPDVTYLGVNVRILSKAAVPYRAHFPNNSLMLPAAAVLAFGCATGLTLYRGRSTGFINTLQLHHALQMAPIGRIPYRTRKTEQAFRESLMSLSMRLFPPYEEPITKHTILVTSAQPHEGKTTVTAGLAEVLAQRNISVALVDADLRVTRRSRRGPRSRGGATNSATGLVDVLRQDVPLGDVIVKRSGVSLVPAGAASDHPSALIGSAPMVRLLAALRASHDVVIIDGPPAPIGGDVYALSRLVDRVVFVIRQSDTNERQIGEALLSVQKAPEDIGIVLNMIRSSGGEDDELAFSPRMMEYYVPSATRSTGT